MVKLEQPVLVLVLLAVLAARGSVEGWYKQAAGPNYYSVGRAAGLLSGIRRSPLRRAELDPPEIQLLPDTQLLHNQVLENTNVCVKNLNLRSCEPIPDDRTVFRCEATVLLVLDSRECVNT